MSIKPINKHIKGAAIGLAAALLPLAPGAQAAAPALPAPADALGSDDLVTVADGVDGAPVAPASTAAPTDDNNADLGGWTPLQGSRFGHELTSKWIPVPNGSSGAPRQGWLATADGFFTREVHLAYDYTDSRFGDRHEVLARFNYPLSRRFWAGLEFPFYQDYGRGVNGIGDATLATRFMLAETRNLSLNAGVAWRLPIGVARTGNGVFAAQPQINIFTDVGAGFSLRGGIGYEFSGSRRASDAFVLNAAIGQTITRHDRAPFGDLTWYVAVNWRSPSTGPDFVSITPGVRTHLGGNLFLLGGVEFPVTNTAFSFRERYIVQLVQGF